jgi:hypothetical protein
MSQTQTLPRRRWTVRAGTDGQGRGLFEVYAVTMEEARASVVKSAEESRNRYLRDLVSKGFTVHVEVPIPWTFHTVLHLNTWVATTPAPDLPRELTDAATHTFI